jgi:NAD(P)-dependent dehydrogenase (short-subunit alcohol dehydrogenase family)
MNNRHVLIVGGTRGIGHSLVKVFAKNSIVSVIGRHPPMPSEKDMPNISYWATDLSDTRRLKKTLKAIILKNGKLGSLIFFQRYRGQGDTWAGEIAVSLTATKNIIEYLTDKFDDAAEKAIVIASSLASHYIVREQPVGYHVAKAGLNQLARFFAVNLAPREIRVNCVIYGAVLKEELRDFYLKHKKLHALYKNITPLGRMALPKDIANAVQFLCSEKASFITGQNLVIDGGLTLIGQESLLLKKFNQQ